MASCHRPCAVGQLRPQLVRGSSVRTLSNYRWYRGPLLCRAADEASRRRGWWPFGGAEPPALPSPPPPPPLLPPPPPPPSAQQQKAQRDANYSPSPDPWAGGASQQQSRQAQARQAQQGRGSMSDALGARSKWDFFEPGGAGRPSAPPTGRQRQQQQRQQGQQQQRQGRREAQQQKQQQQSRGRWVGGRSFNERLGDLTNETNPQWRWPAIGGDAAAKNVRERIKRITKRIEEAQQKDEVVMPPDFEALNPWQYTEEMQRYIEYRRKERLERLEQANDNEISGIAWVYVAVMVLVLVMSGLQQ